MLPKWLEPERKNLEKILPRLRLSNTRKGSEFEK